MTDEITEHRRPTQRRPRSPTLQVQVILVQSRRHQTDYTMTKFGLLLKLAIAACASELAFALSTSTKQENSRLSLQALNGDQEPSRRAFLATAASAVVGLAFAPQESRAFEVGGQLVSGDESIMSPKEHGTSAQAVQKDLLYGVSNKLADKVCNFNRHFAENGGYFTSTSFEDAVLQANGPTTFYDSVTGKPLFVAPLGRSADEFLTESEVHGWPSFRDNEVVWENVRVLKNSGETVAVDGTHLGHNLPDRKGNRYCINLVSVAGKPFTA